jgi:hypothetical protein
MPLFSVKIAYRPEGRRIAIGFGRTPISQGEETRLASPCNIFAEALSDVKALAKLKAGARIKVMILAAGSRLPYPRPTNGIRLAITVMNRTLVSSGRPTM